MVREARPLPSAAVAALATASSNLSYYFEKAPIHVYNYAVTLNSVLTPTHDKSDAGRCELLQSGVQRRQLQLDTHANAQLFLSPDTPIDAQIFRRPQSSRSAASNRSALRRPRAETTSPACWPTSFPTTSGKHQFRFGGEYRQGHVDEFYFFHSLGNLTFDGSQGPWAGSCTANPDRYRLHQRPGSAGSEYFRPRGLSGRNVARSSINAGNAERKIVVNASDFFGSDSWQVTRRLNVNLGLRWDYFGPLHNGSKDIAVFVPG